MKKSGYIAIAIIAASLALDAGSVQAQSASRDVVPAEFPPASFSGRQYVDSRGCVFIRAGVDGNVTWVPRVSRDRKMICGFQPSLTQVAAAEPAPEPATAARTQTRTQATQATTATATTQTRTSSTTASTARATAAATPAATTRQTATTATRPAATATPTRTQATQARVVRVQQQPVPAVAPATPEPQQVRVVTAAPTTAATVARPAEMAPRQTACRGASAISRQYMIATPGVAVRCGPQDRPHVTVVSGGNARSADRNMPTPVVAPQAQAHVILQPAPLPRSAATTAITRQTRVVPKSVYENQIASTRGVYIPEGYRAVWDDDRLSTTRAHQTVGGMADMEIAWTNTVPRLLVERETGKEVTYLFPGLMYPYTSYAQQHAARATVSTRGTASRDVSMMGRHQRDGANRQAVGTAPVPVVAGASASAQTGASTVSTRSVTVARAPQQPPSHRYVQVGVFADQGHAQREAQRIANSGLPTKLGAITRNGTSYGVVISGPFSSQSQLQTALNRVRGMGFNHAKLRN